MHAHSMWSEVDRNYSSLMIQPCVSEGGGARHASAGVVRMHSYGSRPTAHSSCVGRDQARASDRHWGPPKHLRGPSHSVLAKTWMRAPALGPMVMPSMHSDG